MSTDIDNIKQYVDDAELVVVGIGWEFKYASEDQNLKGKILQAYKNLFKLIEGKNHFIISLCYDDLIRESSDDLNIVTPCGTKRLLQCSKHIVKKEDAINDNGSLLCPECGQILLPNTIEAENYIEDGYLDDFARYKKWLQGTVNKKLCILELGVGMQFPTVIRFAFDKLCMYNLKSKFIRIHETLSQHTAENEGRTLSISSNSVEFMSKIY